MSTRKSWIRTVALGLGLVACGELPSIHNPTLPGPSATPGERPDLLATDTTGAVTFVGAGDIAGCSTVYRDEVTAKLILQISGTSGTVFTLGDNAYPNGSGEDYSNCYDSSWGEFKSRTRPTPGNHEYQTTGAAGYFQYYGSLAGPCCRGFYTYKLGKWRIYSLNSEARLDKQLSWLSNHLATYPARCVLAYWHKPLYSAGPHGPNPEMYGTYKALYDAGAEVVLTGHDHSYQRFAPMDADGREQDDGIRQFVVGTGGSPPTDFPNPAPNLEVRHKVRGVMQLSLADGTYSWKFLSQWGKTLDSGTETCH